ncbi:MAG TPA: formimidoylglutamase [Bacteroidales bacterium]|nr:formimidoylglutamase [Bacteroidales bacterium]HPS16015.1 formimidoylglutamase [Bacteroidales bacterium]
MDTDISIYFEPVSINDYSNSNDFRPGRIGDIINAFKNENNFPSLENIDIAIIGVNEDRLSTNNEGTSLAPDQVRKYLYRLYQNNFKTRIVDLGNIRRGHNIEDTYFAVKNVLSELMKAHIIPVVIGGSQDITYANYLAYESLGQIINIVSVDSSFDLGNAEQDMSSKSYLSKIIMHQPNFLFNYTNIGYQTYFVDQDAIDLMGKLYFDVYRLGHVRANIEEVEPYVRNADMVSFDISSIRQSDAPGNANASPNGFYGEEACQITRYAGLSDKLSSIGFYEMNPTFDNSGQTAHLVAQMIWYFIDGFYFRKHDFPLKEKEQYLKYRVSINNHKYEIIFYKSKKSDRWWMEVPCPTFLKSKYERHYLVPCSYKDYQTALKEEMPDRWWQVYQKLM